MPKINIMDKNVVHRIISDINTHQNQKRKEAELDAWQVYAGNVKEYVRARMKKVYPYTYEEFTLSSLSLSQKIVNKKAMAYKDTPMRVLENDLESMNYNLLLELMGFDKEMQIFDTYFNLHKYAGLKFDFDEEGNLYAQALAPYQFDRIVDQWGKTVCVVTSIVQDAYKPIINGDGHEAVVQDEPEDIDLKRYAIWTEENFVIVRVRHVEKAMDIQYEEIPNNKNMVNELGVIPFVFKQEGNSRVLPISSPLTEQTIVANEMMSLILTGTAIQTFSNLIISHPENQHFPDKLESSLFTYMKLEQKEDQPATTAQYINPSPDLAGMLDVLGKYISQVLDEHGIRVGQGLNGGAEKFTSGLDRMISNADTLQIIAKNQNEYSEVEENFYRIIQAYHVANRSNTFTSNKVNVTYEKLRPMIAESDVLANIKTKLELGAIEEWEKFQILNPNLSEEEARAKLDRVEEAKEEKLKSLPLPMDGEDNQDNEVQQFDNQE